MYSVFIVSAVGVIIPWVGATVLLKRSRKVGKDMRAGSADPGEATKGEAEELVHWID